MVLVDSSVWIDFFRGDKSAVPLIKLIESNSICINELILAELIPSIAHKNGKELKNILYSIEKVELKINWSQIVSMQTLNLKNGINRVGIPDLLIVNNEFERIQTLSQFVHTQKLLQPFGAFEPLN